MYAVDNLLCNIDVTFKLKKYKSSLYMTCIHVDIYIWSWNQLLITFQKLRRVKLQTVAQIMIQTMKTESAEIFLKS